jgi:hypothetical protein
MDPDNDRDAAPVEGAFRMMLPILAGLLLLVAGFGVLLLTWRRVHQMPPQYLPMTAKRQAELLDLARRQEHYR